MKMVLIREGLLAIFKFLEVNSIVFFTELFIDIEDYFMLIAIFNLS